MATPGGEAPRQDASTIADDSAAYAGDSEDIGGYRLIRQLGEGGMGVVYHARQREPIRRDVALKVIKPGMDTKEVIARFDSERQALALMDHPNIARVFEGGTTPNGRPYFVMELANGVPITSYCGSNKLTVADRIRVFLPVCRAIQHAHQKGIIHRDIKPSNILVATHDGKPAPKVIDFGLAKALGHQLSDATAMTSLGTVVGTVEYMSPEQSDLMRHDIDTRSDVYSLGVVLYEVLTGDTPLGHDATAKTSQLEILRRIREEDPPAPSARVQRAGDSVRRAGLLRGELDWIVMKALAKDRALRYETVNGMLRDLERYLNGEPVEAGPPSAAYRVRKFICKYRTWLTAAAASAVLLLIAALVSIAMAVRAGRAEREARAVSDFLRQDLLSQGSAEKRRQAGAKPDPDLKMRTVLDSADAIISARFQQQPAVEASIRQAIGETYSDLGLYPQAQHQEERALELRLRVLGERSPETLETIEHLAHLYRRQGAYARAEELLTRVIGIRRRLGGEENPATLRMLNELAGLYGDQGKYSQAEPLFTHTLAIQSRVLGEDHPDTLETMNDLGVVYFEHKDPRAEALYLQALAGRRRVLGEEHPSTLSTMNNLALQYRNQGRYAEAEQLSSRVWEIRKRILGQEHPLTLISASTVAALALDQGRYAEGERLFTHILEIQRRLLGEENPNTLLNMDLLVVVLRSERKFGQADPLSARVLEIERRVLGEEHPYTLNALSVQAALDHSEGKYPQAEVLYKKVIEARGRVLGRQHLVTLSSRNDLALLLYDEGKFSQAEAQSREALAGFQKSAPDHWRIYESEAILGSSLLAQGKDEQAAPLLSSAHEGLKAREMLIPAIYRSILEQVAKWVTELNRSLARSRKATLHNKTAPNLAVPHH
ncbi:MAG TPA: serine/threonine-protein kinase [Bryobacteraceae bacterium]|nr:serine/threonine-protein kinase [Bryobacteraceae bacterium]